MGSELVKMSQRSWADAGGLSKMQRKPHGVSLHLSFSHPGSTSACSCAHTHTHTHSGVYTSQCVHTQDFAHIYFVVSS